MWVVLLFLHSWYIYIFFFWLAPLSEIPSIPTHPCIPSPCGPNSVCQVKNEEAACSCLPEFKGQPPFCRPECISNSECPSNLACINMKCKDPCLGSCGLSAICHVTNHIPNCYCENGLTGNPISACYPVPREYFHKLKTDYLFLNLGFVYKLLPSIKMFNLDLLLMHRVDLDPPPSPPTT